MTERRNPIRLLLVEDNAGDALLMTALLKENDPTIEIHVATDGQAAGDYLTRRDAGARLAPPDVVILDINLPKKNGFEVLADIRSQPELVNLPVFMVTGSCAKEDRVKGHALGAASFITKPSGLSEFEETVKRFMAFELPQALNLKD